MSQIKMFQIKSSQIKMSRIKMSKNVSNKNVSNKNVEYTDLLSIALSNTVLVPNFSSPFYTHFLPFCGSCPSKLVCSLEIPEIALGTCDKIHRSERAPTSRPEKNIEVPWIG
jgi:hypothetical protein